MNEQQMRDRIDEVLCTLERKLQQRRRNRLKIAGPAAGMMLALDACIKEPMQPAYGIQVDATASDSNQADVQHPLDAAYGIPDFGRQDLQVLYGVDAAVDAGPDDSGPGDLGTLYGIADAYGIADNG